MLRFAGHIKSFRGTHLDRILYLKKELTIFNDDFFHLDRELNAWCTLRKTCQYRSDHEEKHDLQVFKSKGNNIELKKKVLPSLYAEDPVRKCH